MSVCPLQLAPRAPEVKMNRRGLFEKPLVDSLMIDRRRSGPVIFAGMPKDIPFGGGKNHARKTDCAIAVNRLEKIAVGRFGNFRERLLTVPKYQNRRRTL